MSQASPSVSWCTHHNEPLAAASQPLLEIRRPLVELLTTLLLVLVVQRQRRDTLTQRTCRADGLGVVSGL